MNKRILLMAFFYFATSPTANARTTYFSTDFEYAQEPTGLLESIELNGATGQIGGWSGDDFPEGDATGFFSGGVVGGDSAGFEDNPHGGRMLFVDRPLTDAIHFMELTESIPTNGAEFSFTAGTRRTGGNGAKDYEFFGLDTDGNRSFHLRIGTDSTTQRLGYVVGDDAFWDLPTLVGSDAEDDISNAGQPPFAVTDDMLEVTLAMVSSGFTVDIVNLNGANSYSTELLPYDGTATELSRVALFYRGSDSSNAQQSGFFVDDLRVTGAADQLQGDFDGDGDIDFADFLTLSANFGMMTSKGDFDSNGTVDFTDFLGFSKAFSEFNEAGANASIVPEPNGFILLLVGWLVTRPWLRHPCRSGC